MKPPTGFRDFAVGAYRRPGVADACLALQAQHGLDVNILLYCCWHGCTRGALDGPSLERILSFAKPWADHVVHPLRAARTWLKTTGPAEAPAAGDGRHELREEIKRVELEAEYLQEDRMEALTRQPALHHIETKSRLNSILLNLRAYFLHLGITLDRQSSAALAQIVVATVGGAALDTTTAATVPNGIAPNAATPNAIAPNAIAPNAATPNATTPNAAAARQTTINGGSAIAATAPNAAAATTGNATLAAVTAAIRTTLP